jgi:hypothetical protein
VLLRAGGDARVRNQQGWSAIDIASHRGLRKLEGTLSASAPPGSARRQGDGPWWDGEFGLGREDDVVTKAYRRSGKPEDATVDQIRTWSARADNARGPRGSHRTPWHPVQDPLDPLQIGKVP